MDKEINYLQLMECFGTLQSLCRMNESCTSCLLYDPEEKETACLICKAEGNSLADNIAAARDTICLSNTSLAPRKIIETNGDRIRSMTDDELAMFLVSEEHEACPHCGYNNDDDPTGCDYFGPCGKDCHKYLLKLWLSSKAEPSSEADPAGNEEHAVE